jgi:restriction endonuclease S subunit
MNGQVIKDTKEKITNEAVHDSNVKLIPQGTTLLSFKLSIGKTAIAGKDLYTNEAIAGLIPIDKDKILDMYLFQIFEAKLIDLESADLNVFGKSLNVDFLKKEVRIPLPPIAIQKDLIKECHKIDMESELAKKSIQEKKIKIEKLLSDFERQGYPLRKIADLAKINPSKNEIRNLDKNTIVSFIDMASVSENGYIICKQDRLLKNVSVGSYRYFAEGDIIVAKITPCMENGKCAIATNLTNGIGFGSSEFHVFRTDAQLISNKYLFLFLNRKIVREKAAQNMTGASGHRRVPETFYKGLKIPFPENKKNQNVLISEIEKIETEIKKTEDFLCKVTTMKKDVIRKYLN